MSEKTKQSKILVVLTGGTICSFANEHGEQESDTKKAQTLIVSKFRSSDSAYREESRVVFDTKRPLDILSENMTIRHWNTLIKKLKTYDFSQYDGMILLHGTDTLAYTASLLSVLLAGIGKPVFLVSSQQPLYEAAANGNDNFKTAVEHIVRGIRPNVYAAYRNDEADGSSMMYIHLGAHLLQCPNHSSNFYSADMTAVRRGEFYEGVEAAGNAPLLYQCDKLTNCVLKIEPYVGIDYSRFSLKGVKAVLHHTYHSSTMAVNPYRADVTKDSILYLKKRCDAAKRRIDVYIEPCNKDETYLYETTGEVLRSGVGTSWRTTSETAYVKLLVGCALGYEGDALQAFIDREINGEFVR